MKKYENITWRDALERLLEGNVNFVEDKLNGMLQNSSRRDELVQSQHPFAVVLTCSDSRVVPEIAFDTGLGEVFVIRVAGNIANKSTVATVEYAVAKLGVKLVLVLGHESCGAITSALENKKYGENLDYLMEYFKPSIINYSTDSVNEVAVRHAKHTVKRLAEKSEIITHALSNHSVKLLSAYYHLKTGKVELLDNV